jgi:rhodanese-related sulfurtransferase
MLNFIRSLMIKKQGGADDFRNEILKPEDVWKEIKEGATIIDCRGESEIQSGMIPGAIHIPHTDIGARANEIGREFTKPVVVYCGIGGRASIVKKYLEHQGFKKVINGGGYQSLSACGIKQGYLD